jgi:hypothetical protein
MAPGQGKSTFAQILDEYHGFHRVSFATPIKELSASFLASAGYDINDAWDMVTDPARKDALVSLGTIMVTPRRIMQTLGTEWGRQSIYENLWVELACQTIDNLIEDGVHHIVVDDLRFPNEWNALSSRYDTTFICVKRPGKTLAYSHISEGGLSEELAHLVLDNNTTIGALVEDAAFLMEELL